MKSKQDIYLNVDLDFFNDHPSPINGLKSLLDKIDTKIPCQLMIEHQRALGHVKNAVKQNKIKIPFEIIHIDEHHDYYRIDKEPNDILDCGNFMSKIPRNFYNSVTWYSNKRAVTEDWKEAVQVLSDDNIKAKLIVNPEPEKMKVNWKNVRFITFCISPDYCFATTRDNIPLMIREITSHFKLKTSIERRDEFGDWNVRGWIPVRKLKNGHIRYLKKLDNIATGANA